MRFKSSFLILGLVAASFGCASSSAPVASGRKIIPQGTPSFTSQTHGFAVWFPVQPVPSEKVESLDNGGTHTTFTFRAALESINYAVQISPYRPDFDASDPTGNLDDFQKGTLQPSGTTLLKREDIQLNGFQGRELEISLLNGTAKMRTRFYLTPKGSFSVAAGGYNDAMQQKSAQIDKVFDSFRILPQ